MGACKKSPRECIGRIGGEIFRSLVDLNTCTIAEEAEGKEKGSRGGTGGIRGRKRKEKRSSEVRVSEGDHGEAIRQVANEGGGERRKSRGE